MKSPLISSYTERASNSTFSSLFQDKTFGLKNKKGSKNQKFIAQVEKQVKQGGDPKARKMEEMRKEEKKKRDEARMAAEEAKKLFRPVMGKEQKVEEGESGGITGEFGSRRTVRLETA